MRVAAPAGIDLAVLLVYGPSQVLESRSLARLLRMTRFCLGQDKGRELADVIGNPAPLAAGHHSCFVSQSQRTLCRWTKKLRLPSVTCFALQNSPSVYHPLNSRQEVRRKIFSVLVDKHAEGNQFFPLLFKGPCSLTSLLSLHRSSCTFPFVSAAVFLAVNATRPGSLAVSGRTKISNHVSVTVYQKPHPPRFVTSSPTPLLK
jgi:hypothetical protein